MKKFFCLTIFLLIVIINSIGQINITEATKIANEYIKSIYIYNYLLYQKPDVNYSETIITTYIGSITSVSSDSWLFFIDKAPLGGWSHDCSFLFVDVNSGKIQEKEWMFPPNDIGNWKLLTRIKEQPVYKPASKSFNLKKPNTNISRGLEENCYAVIISGGGTPSLNFKRYWNACSFIYTVLVEEYGYDESHIYPLISDGDDEDDDRCIAHDPSYVYDSSPLDLDGDEEDDYSMSATKENIATVFNTLSNILDNDDFLFIFVTDHGFLDEFGTEEVGITLWYEPMTDDEFKAEVDKVNAGHISIVMGQCHSGGFIDDLGVRNNVIATSALSSETAWAMGVYTYDEFLFHWMSAVNWEDPYENSVDADVNDDGYISMEEAFDYAEEEDEQDETPQYYSNSDNLGKYMTLLGLELCTTEYLYNESLWFDQTIEDCNIDIDIVVINIYADVILDAANDVIIHSIWIKPGASLEIK